MKPKDLPIGYWIKKADQLLTQGIDQIQSGFGLTRTDWQILNAVKESNEILKSDLAELMQPFADAAAVENTLSRFSQNGIIEAKSPTLRLTAKGQETHRNCLEKQIIFRKQCMRDISEQEYQTTFATLKKLVANLEKE